MDILMQWLNRFLQWGTETSALPYIAALVILALGFAGMWYKAQWATIPHELGHAFVALLLGKKLSGIDINRDSSGETRTTEYRHHNFLVDFILIPFRWVRNILVSFAGYPAPFALAFVLIYFWSKDQSKIAVVIMLVMLVFTFLYSTNIFGFLLVLGGIAVTGFALWLDSPFMRELLVVFISGGMLAGGIRGVVEAWQVYKADSALTAENWADPYFEPQHSDARALSRRTLIPQIVWLVVFSLVGAALFLLTMSRLALAYL